MSLSQFKMTITGEQLTLLRSESGKVFLIDSYCPHLGASFSVGGRVVDDNCVQVNQLFEAFF